MQEAAQILMDCVADIVDSHGLGPLRSMCAAMQLQRLPSDAEATAHNAANGAQGQQQQPQQPPVQYLVTSVMPDGISPGVKLLSLLRVHLGLHKAVFPMLCMLSRQTQIQQISVVWQDPALSWSWAASIDACADSLCLWQLTADC